MALISSGDAGVYGMAGPTFEVLFQAGGRRPLWTRTARPKQAALWWKWCPAPRPSTAARPGGRAARTTFCAISLSDLLTPWPTIARRLDAVAYSDFVVALYNPKSGRRTQIVGSAAPFCHHRSPDTPVAIVKAPTAAVSASSSPRWRT